VPFPAPLFLDIEPFGVKHKPLRAAFSCGEETLDRYLKQQASQDAEKRVALPFMLVSQDNRLAGYYTLGSYGIPSEGIPPELVKQLRLPRYEVIGATLLGRLARDLAFRGQGIGEILLIDALKRALYGSRTVAASVGVIVDAKNENARRFYSEYGFLTSFPDTPRRLFLRMETIEELLGVTSQKAR
jgi:ribosomal protein S18 acetylase RimI-like enzyme